MTSAEIEVTMMKSRSVAACVLIALCTSAAFAHVDNRTRQFIEQLKRDAGEVVKTYSTVDWSRPYCSVGFHQFQGYVTFVTATAREGGLREGDKLVSLDGTPFNLGHAARYDFDSPYRRKAPGEKVRAAVIREGKSVDLDLQCGDAREFFKLEQKGAKAILAEDWDTCISAANELDARYGPAVYHANVRFFCSESNRLEDGRLPQAFDGAAQYERWRRGIRTFQFIPGGFEQNRAEFLGVLAWLRGSNLSSFADELESLWEESSAAKGHASSPKDEVAAGARSLGTCFAVRPDGTLLTAHHVIAGATSIRVRFRDGELKSAVVSKASPANDLAVLKIETTTPDFLSLQGEPPVQSGQEVFTIGYPAPQVLGEEAKFTEGSVSATTGPGNEASLIQVSIPLQPGNSGGPIVTHSGSVVGIVTASAAIKPFLVATGTLPQNVNWAINSEFARPMFDVPQPRHVSTRDEAIALTKKAVCYVEAERPPE